MATRTKKMSPDASTVRDVLVAFSDIVAWSREDAVGQSAFIRHLNHRTMSALTGLSPNLKPSWRTGTGDGFGLAFPSTPTTDALALDALFRLYEDLVGDLRFQIRLSACKGPVLVYSNELLGGQPDLCGPAVIRARRLLDAAAPGCFLVDGFLADSLEGLARDPWGRRFLPAQTYVAKHGLEVRARRLVGEAEGRYYADVSVRRATSDVLASQFDVLAAASSIGLEPHGDIVATATRLQTSLTGVDRLLIHWLDTSGRGIPPDAVVVKPFWSPESFHETGTPGEPLASLSEDLLASIRPFVLDPASDIPESSNRPKVWVMDWLLPMSDRPVLTLTVGGSDYRTTKALERAFLEPVEFQGQRRTLRDAFDLGALKLEEDWPSAIVTHISLLSSDGCLLLAQRSGGRRVGFAPGRYSPSCEEQWDPSREQAPHETVLRCLREEWNLDERKGFAVPAESVKLVALGREWGKYWTTVMVYIVELPFTAAKILECWRRLPADRAEAAGVGAVSVRERHERTQVLRMAQTRLVYPRELARTCGAIWAGSPTDNELHDTTGVARIALSLAHRFGVAAAGFDGLGPSP